MNYRQKKELASIIIFLSEFGKGQIKQIKANLHI